MDIRAERAYKEQMKTDARQFVPMFDDSFSGLYRYVARRVEDEVVREQIVRLVYLDALGQAGNCPMDVNFLTWLFAIAHGRVSEYVRGSVVGTGPAVESPIFDGAGMVDGVYDDESKLRGQAEVFFSSLTFEERDIIRLKFFEELTDGEVMYILNVPEMRIGTRIYQVLRRGYEILFGKVEDSAVYYGELYSFLARLRAIEKIPAPENLKLKLKIEVKEKAEKMWGEKWGEGSGAQPRKAESGFSVDEVGQKGSGVEGSGAQGLRAQGLKPEDSNRFGSSDPAKIFVQAAKGMSKEEIDRITKEYVEEREKKADSHKNVVETEFPGEKFYPDTSVPGFETIQPETVPVQYISDDEEAEKDFQKSLKAEKFLDFWDKWKYVMSLVPSGLFVLGVIAVLGVVLFSGVRDDGVTGLPFRVDYSFGFEETNREDISATVDYEKKALIENSLVAEIAKGKDVDYVKIWVEEGGIGMNFRLEKVEDGFCDAVGAICTADGKPVSAIEYLFEETGGGGSSVNYRVKKFKKL